MPPLRRPSRSNCREDYQFFGTSRLARNDIIEQLVGVDLGKVLDQPRADIASSVSSTILPRCGQRQIKPYRRVTGDPVAQHLHIFERSASIVA
jgi:hypothetical protein